MASSRMLPMKLVIAVGLLFTISVCSASKGAKKSAASSSTRLESSLDDELIPSYECAHRSRDWTLRCLVPVTNFQMSLDLCETKQKPDEKHVEQCAKELYILGKSCPQTSMTDAAREMMNQKKPPPPPKSNSKQTVKPSIPQNSLPALSKAYASTKEHYKTKHKHDL